VVECTCSLQAYVNLSTCFATGICDAPRNEVNLFTHTHTYTHTHTHTPASPDGGATGATAAPPPPPPRGGCEGPRFAAAPMDARLGDIVNPGTRSVAFAPCTQECVCKKCQQTRATKRLKLVNDAHGQEEHTHRRRARTRDACEPARNTAARWAFWLSHNVALWCGHCATRKRELPKKALSSDSQDTDEPWPASVAPLLGKKCMRAEKFCYLIHT
jgi:hypothetical protein